MHVIAPIPALRKRIKELEAENAMQSKLIAEQDAQLKKIYQIIYDNREAK